MTNGADETDSQTSIAQNLLIDRETKRQRIDNALRSVPSFLIEKVNATSLVESERVFVPRGQQHVVCGVGGKITFDGALLSCGKFPSQRIVLFACLLESVLKPGGC